MAELLDAIALLEFTVAERSADSDLSLTDRWSEAWSPVDRSAFLQWTRDFLTYMGTDVSTQVMHTACMESHMHALPGSTGRTAYDQQPWLMV